jgi:hypothetical protein
MQLIGWRDKPFGTRYWIRHAGHVYTYQRIPPSLYVPTGCSSAKLASVRWCLESVEHVRALADAPSNPGLERLHARRVLELVPRLTLSLWGRLGDVDVVRVIIALYAAIKK